MYTILFLWSLIEEKYSWMEYTVDFNFKVLKNIFPLPAGPVHQ